MGLVINEYNYLLVNAIIILPAVVSILAFDIKPNKTTKKTVLVCLKVWLVLFIIVQILYKIDQK